VARALLARGHRVRVLARAGGDRRNIAGLDVEVAEGELGDAAALARAASGCRFVMHVAADYRIWVPDEDAMLRANVEGTRAMMRAALAAGAERVVHCSSVAALGLTADGTPADEATPVSEAGIVGIYKKSKFRAEQAVLAMVRDEGLPAVIVNPAAPIGPRDIKPTPTGRMVADAASGKVPAYIDTGLCVVHVDDVAEGHVLALERGRIGERYILGGDNLLLRDLLGLVARTAGRSPPRIKLPAPLLWPVALACEALAGTAGIDPLVTRDHLRMARKRMFFSHAKAARELGFAPRPAAAAIADAVTWFRAQGMVPA
jgi:dihydroflavonol-4-reductase